MIEIQLHRPEATYTFNYSDPTPTPTPTPPGSPDSETSPLLQRVPFFEIADYIEAYNERFPENAIPSFVICSSWSRAPRFYTSVEIFLAIQRGLRDIHNPTHPRSRRYGPTWPRPLGFFNQPHMRPSDAGEASHLLLEYPLRPRDEDLGRNEGILDRVTFDPRGLFTGILRYHDRHRWHYCYPEGFHRFLGRHRTRAGARDVPGPVVLNDPPRPPRWQPGTNRRVADENEVPAVTPDADDEIREETWRLPVDEWDQEHDEPWIVNDPNAQAAPVASNDDDDMWWDRDELEAVTTPVADHDDAWWEDGPTPEITPVTSDVGEWWEDNALPEAGPTTPATTDDDMWWEEEHDEL